MIKDNEDGTITYWATEAGGKSYQETVNVWDAFGGGMPWSACLVVLDIRTREIHEDIAKIRRWPV